jgi:hypothetical protein
MRFTLFLLIVLLACLAAALWMRVGVGGQSVDALQGDANATSPPASTRGPIMDQAHTDGSLVPAQRANAIVEALVYEEPEEWDEWEEESESAEELRFRYEGLDLIQNGACTLDLRFLDSLSGRPVSGIAHLWRLDAPGNEWWTEGDQRQAALEVKDGKVTVKDLPPGRFRVHAHFARRESESAPEFQVEGDFTSVQIPVEMPSAQRIRLHLVDIHGAPLPSASHARLELMRFWSPSHHFGELRPQWITRRRPVDPSVQLSARLGGASMSASPTPWRVVEQTSSGVDLGEIREDPREYHTNYLWKIRVNGGQVILVELQAVGTTDYVAIMPDPTAVLHQIEWPAGVVADDLRDTIKITARAVPIDWSKGETISGCWSLCRIQVGVSSRDFQSAKVQWGPGEGPMPPIQLLRK